MRVAFYQDLILTCSLLTTLSTMRQLVWILSYLLLGNSCSSNAFVLRQSQKSAPPSRPRTPTALQEFREYVPLIVSGAVIVDILAGSPFVNAVMSFARPKEETGVDQKRELEEELSNERIDSKQVAADAVERAQNVLELRQMLEDNKSDWDRIQDMQRKVEQQQAELDQRS